MKLLNKKQIKSEMAALDSDWKLNAKNTKLTKIIATNNFLDGVLLLSRITVHAEVLKHHPEVNLSYNRLKVSLTTHEAKGLTKLDFKLAKRIDQF